MMMMPMIAPASEAFVMNKEIDSIKPNKIIITDY